MTARSLRPAVTLIGAMREACRRVPAALLVAAVMLLPGAAATADTGEGAGDDVPAATDDATDAGHGADGVAEHPELALPDKAIPILLDADLGRLADFPHALQDVGGQGGRGIRHRRPLDRCRPRARSEG